MINNTTLQTHDGHTIRVTEWRPATDPILVVQILHGMGEHIGRYAEFAEQLNAAGIAVVGHNHRGHGEHAAVRGHFADHNGWDLVVEDAYAVTSHAKSTFDGLPLVLFGHSMGSFLAQDFAARHGAELRGLVLSGSTWPSKFKLIPGWIAGHLTRLGTGRRGYSPTLDKNGIDTLNKPFAPTRTAADWLSRDETRVDAYVADTLCGPPFTVGFWLDLVGGMLRVGSDGLLNRIRSDLPILIVGGGADPVGGDKGLGDLMMHYAQTGHQRLKLKIYPDARHEMLNETNRDAAIADIQAWLQPLAKPSSS